MTRRAPVRGEDGDPAAWSTGMVMMMMLGLFREFASDPENFLVVCACLFRIRAVRVDARRLMSRMTERALREPSGGPACVHPSLPMALVCLTGSFIAYTGGPVEANQESLSVMIGSSRSPVPKLESRNAPHNYGARCGGAAMAFPINPRKTKRQTPLDDQVIVPWTTSSSLPGRHCTKVRIATGG